VNNYLLFDMPPRKRLKAVSTPAKTRKGGRRRKQDEDEVPQVFQEMLVEAAISSQSETQVKPRPMKRRRVSPQPSAAPLPLPAHKAEADIPITPLAPSASFSRPQQIVYDDFGSSDDGSDVEFEDVAIDNNSEDDDHPEQKPLQLDLSARIPPRSITQRRKPVSKAERDYRLNVHKTHLLLLLMNLQLRRAWCESEDIQAILKPLIPSNLRNMLHVSEDKPAYQRTHAFNKALEEISAIWRNEFEITGPGMRRAYWREDTDAMRALDEFDDPSNYAEFRKAARTRLGSRDLGAVLFCALLRSAAVDTRLVCSLQVLPFSAIAKGQTPEKPKAEYAYRTTWPSQEFPTSSNQGPSNARWRQSEYAGATAPLSRDLPIKKKFRDSPYPITWVEVMLPTGAWVPVDPLVRKTINKPRTGFEPPLSDSLNSMSYAIAFEETGYAKDVTRRYTQFFNAKTRKQRVESTKNGDYWWSVTMQWFRRFQPGRLESDLQEDEDLRKKSESEPMPKNIADFKDHPVFALERHLRRNEVIWPNEHRGFFVAGNKDGKSEKIFDRKNVHIVRSADQWYRKGRDLKEGEQPLKRVAMRKRRGTSIYDDEDNETQDGTLLYAEFQTEVYVPPPVVKGRIPKNQYGNLDVYVPSMIPPGAVHIQHPEARNAARLLRIDFTDAVTGFKFKGRQGTAVVNGIVAAAEFKDALVEVVEALEYERVREQEEKQTLVALSMWKKFMAALLVRQRINEEHAQQDDRPSNVEDAATSSGESADENSTYSDSDDGAGGGFMPDTENAGDGGGYDAVDLAKLTLDPQQAVYHEVIIVESPHKASQQFASRNGQIYSDKPVPSLVPKDSLFDDDDADDGLFNGSDHDEPGGFVVEDNVSADGGGFVRDEAEDIAGGGLLLDDETQIARDLPHLAHAEVEDRMEEKPASELPLSLPKDIADELATPASSEALTSNVAKEDQKDDDAESLLSHDPDDDDVEEAWTMDIDSE
jgi:xeroderma pigmentosum group C-complementing protein